MSGQKDKLINLLTLPIGTVVKVKSKHEIELLGSGFVGICHANKYGIIEIVQPETGCYYIKDLDYGWDDRLIEKVDDPIGIYLVEYDGTISSEKYCSKKDGKAKDLIIEGYKYDLHEFNNIVVEEL